MSKNLVVYYSHSGNTRKGAKLIQSALGADILELEPQKKYSSDLWGAVDEFKIELAEDSRREIKPYQLNLEDYDTIFIGTPNWGDTVATPLLSFFDKEDLSHKKIMPFVTHGGGGVGNCASNIVKFSASSTYGKELVYTGSGINETSVVNWLENEKCL